MSKAVVFARRNILEIVRSPISWIFGLLMPVGIFIIMQVIVKSIGEEALAVAPMFAVERFTGGIMIFGAAFLSLFAALIISTDRKESFLSRLFASPMKSSDYIIGYALGVFPIALAQVVITFVTALCFGLTPTVHILAALGFSVVIALLYTAIGVIFGSCLSAKNAPPLCSVVVQIAALLSGMWFDLDTIGGGFSIFCHILPFAHAYDLIRYTLAGDYGNVWLPFLVVAAHTAALSVLAVVLFRYRAKKV
ncbi:MAG: ABC transporter permease [Clostridiales bacterium]|nr:ABC transporter permease [Clostridiales bacterium]